MSADPSTRRSARFLVWHIVVALDSSIDFDAGLLNSLVLCCALGYPLRRHGPPDSPDLDRAHEAIDLGAVSMMSVGNASSTIPRLLVPKHRSNVVDRDGPPMRTGGRNAKVAAVLLRACACNTPDSTAVSRMKRATREEHDPGDPVARR